MGISLNGLTPAGTYPGLIKTGDNTAIDGTPKVLSDGNGNNLPMEVSTTGVNFTNQLQQGGVAVPTASQVAAKQDTLVSGTNIKTINGTSVLGSGNIPVVTSPSGVAGAIQFSDGSAFASDAANFFWDDTNKRLGIGTNSPSATGHFKGSGSTSATTSLLVQNSAGSDLIRINDVGWLQFGGTTSSFPAMQRNLSEVRFRLADGSGFCNIRTKQIRFENASALSDISDGVIIMANNALNDFNRLQFGGVTSSFPALKRSTTNLQVRLADDSGYAPIDASLYKVGGTNGFTGTGSYTNFTIVGGIITNAS
jgi:hypothetical protein